MFYNKVTYWKVGLNYANGQDPVSSGLNAGTLDMRARQLTDKAFWTFDGWCPRSAIVAGHETIAMYCTKRPERAGSRNEQELHLLRLSKAPEDVAKVFHSRCACIRLGCRRLLQVVVVVVVVGRTCRCCVCVCVRGRLCFSAAQGGQGEPRGSHEGARGDRSQVVVWKRDQGQRQLFLEWLRTGWKCFIMYML